MLQDFTTMDALGTDDRSGTRTLSNHPILIGIRNARDIEGLQARLPSEYSAVVHENAHRMVFSIIGGTGTVTQIVSVSKALNDNLVFASYMLVHRCAQCVVMHPHSLVRKHGYDEPQPVCPMSEECAVSRRLFQRRCAFVPKRTARAAVC